MSEAYREFTVPINQGGTIREMDNANLLPGDLAVTTDGLHVLVFCGDDRWIQADPESDKVLTLNGRTGDSSWFYSPVTMHRWKLLESAP